MRACVDATSAVRGRVKGEAEKERENVPRVGGLKDRQSSSEGAEAEGVRKTGGEGRGRGRCGRCSSVCARAGDGTWRYRFKLRGHTHIHTRIHIRSFIIIEGTWRYRFKFDEERRAWRAVVEHLHGMLVLSMACCGRAPAANRFCV